VDDRLRRLIGKRSYAMQRRTNWSKYDYCRLLAAKRHYTKRADYHMQILNDPRFGFCGTMSLVKLCDCMKHLNAEKHWHANDENLMSAANDYVPSFIARLQ
ncbi:hypothetical protein THOM_1966, partial [Trachipleistophora hominis]